uniref:Uncharacterized protein n=1 Tax=Sphaeramia orbicularis TaxID=375764 RepID=A0A673A2S4_9TELE
CFSVTIAAVAAGAGGSVLLAPVALGAIGFTSAGIAAGSYAAGMMSTTAIANGGGVAAGSLVALGQSAGKTNRETFYLMGRIGPFGGPLMPYV